MQNSIQLQCICVCFLTYCNFSCIAFSNFSHSVFCRVEEANDWVMRLTDSGGSNLLKALKCVTQLPDIDTIVIILGSL